MNDRQSALLVANMLGVDITVDDDWIEVTAPDDYILDDTGTHNSVYPPGHWEVVALDLAGGLTACVTPDCFDCAEVTT